MINAIRRFLTGLDPVTLELQLSGVESRIEMLEDETVRLQHVVDLLVSYHPEIDNEANLGD